MNSGNGSANNTTCEHVQRNGPTPPHVGPLSEDDMDYEPSQGTETEEELDRDGMFDEEEEIDEDDLDDVYYEAIEMHRHDDFDDEPNEEDADDDYMHDGEEEEGEENDDYGDGGLLHNHRTVQNPFHVYRRAYENLAHLLLHGRRQQRWKELMKADLQVPNMAGTELMHSGDFGFDELRKRRRKEGTYKKQTLYFRRLEKEFGRYKGERARIVNQLLSQPLVPTSHAEFVIHYNQKCYSGQFSQDGNFFFCCSQDFRVRMYDTSDPYKWKHYKTVPYPNGQWTITDASLSPDNRFLAYSSINTTVYMANTAPGNEEQLHSLEFGLRHFGIWSIRFSGDGREIVAGANDHNLYVYDLESRRVTLTLSGHDDDVNAVCFADKDSPHILFSGSDDATIKIWDRRSMSRGREVGVFAGHLEGLTFVDSKGDGRYVLSNGKDQTMKLWDLRKMLSPDQFSKLSVKNYSTDFDYRMEPYPLDSLQHPNDCSLVTFRGHKVLKTLIRCHFSPEMSSGARYVYTGSADGRVHIFNLDATVADTIDVASSAHHPGIKIVNDRRFHRFGYTFEDEEDVEYIRRYGHARPTMVVRDASWHPNAPILAATGWSSGAYGNGSVNVFTCGGMEENETGKIRRFGPGMKEVKIDREMVNLEGGEEEELVRQERRLRERVLRRRG